MAEFHNPKSRKNVHIGKPAKRLAARIKSFNERGPSNKIAETLRKPGSQNRKK